MISLEEIVSIVKKDSKIKAIYMNGSRCNSNVKPDKYQDYDLVFVADNIDEYTKDLTLVESFGSIAYYQMPEYYEHLLGKESKIKECYGWLVQYKEGFRIDLHIVTPDYALRTIKSDSLTIILYDKNNILPALGSPSEESYYLKKPSQLDFEVCCNEFWWCLNSVAKGIKRNDYLSTFAVIDSILRVELLKLLGYLAGYKYDYKINVGKSSKYLGKYIDSIVYAKYLGTYSNANMENIVKAVVTMIELFDETATKVAKYLSYAYDENEAKNSRDYLMSIINDTNIL